MLLNFPSHSPLWRLSISPPFVSKLQCILLLCKEDIVSIACGFSVWPTEVRHRQLFPFPNLYSGEELQGGCCLTGISYWCKAEMG